MTERLVEVGGVEFCITHQGIVDECSDRGDCCDMYDPDDPECNGPCDIQPVYYKKEQ